MSSSTASNGSGRRRSHGLAELVGHPITTDSPAQFLADTNVKFEAIEPKPSEAWAAYTARRITAEL